MDRSRAIKLGVIGTMGSVFVLSLVVWAMTRDRLPSEIRIATAAPGGLYCKIGTMLAPHIVRRTSRRVTIIETEGTGDNCTRLREGSADLAILQAGATCMTDLVALAPLYHDVVLVIVRRNAGIETFRELAGRRVALGLPKSGMRASSMALLEHYDVDIATISSQDRYFLDLLDDEALDAALVTTGFANPDLETVLATGMFDILEIQESAAFCLRNPAYNAISIPQGLYGHGPALPPRDIKTVATTAFLAARADVSAKLVTETLDALYTTDVRTHVPTLMAASDALAWPHTPMHPTARNYFDPYGGIDTLASFMESLAAGKELLFALGAGLYLLWEYYRRTRAKERELQIREMKDRLDALLAETGRIERAQMDTDDDAQLKSYLDEITRIKLQALDELTHEDLRGDRMFLIFLIQCGNVINKIQAKIMTGAVPTD